MSRSTASEPVDAQQLLAAANPVPPAARTALDERACRDLAAILARPSHVPATPLPARSRPVREFPTRRGVLAAGVAVAATVAVMASGVVDLPGGGGAPDGAYAATPAQLVQRPLSGDARGVLREIAARTAVLPDDTGGGRYAMVDQQSWSLWTRVGGGVPTSVVVPQETTTWLAADGSGRVVTRHTVPGEETVVDDQQVPAGQLATMWPLGSLPADDAALAARLEEQHPVENGPAERLVAVGDAHRQMPLSPPVRAAVLRYLAATPGLQLDGAVTDRLGRPGVAVSVTSDHSGLPTRYALIVDPGSGRLLGEEQTLTETAGELDVPIPSVVAYTAYRDSRYTPTDRS